MLLLLTLACGSDLRPAWDAVLAQDGEVTILLDQEGRWQWEGGRDPVPRRRVSETAALTWGDRRVELTDHEADAPPTPWTGDDAVTLKVVEDVAVYQHADRWWAVYAGTEGLFHGPAPVDPQAVPPLREVRPALFHRQVRPDLRTLLVADARAEGEDALVALLVGTVDAREHIQGEHHWESAWRSLSPAGQAEVDAALARAYRAAPSTFVIKRAAAHLDLAGSAWDDANRAALRALQQAAATEDAWGEHHTARLLLPEIACSDAFAYERAEAAVDCP